VRDSACSDGTARHFVPSADRQTEGVSAAPRLSDGVVVLDRHRLSDADAHLAGEDEEQARRFGWYPAASTRVGVRRAIRRWQRQWSSGGARRAFAIRDGQTGALAGGCEVRVGEDGLAEISYWVFPPFRGRGFARRAIGLACEWAFAELRVERMEIYVEPDNAASRSAALRAGFTEEGVLRARGRFGEERRDLVLYSRLPSDRMPALGARAESRGRDLQGNRAEADRSPGGGRRRASRRDTPRREG
jgi:RimJ/RimL family protein N-acetyltransferase